MNKWFRSLDHKSTNMYISEREREREVSKYQTVHIELRYVDAFLLLLCLPIQFFLQPRILHSP